jgi:hypothetical protein
MDGTLQLIVNIGAAATALAAIIGLPVAIVKLWPLLKRAVTIGASLEKLPEMSNELRALTMGQRAQGDTLTAQNASLATITDEVEKVKQQVKNDHDSNLREDLDEVRDHVLDLHAKLDLHLTAPKTTINVNPGGAA